MAMERALFPLSEFFCILIIFEIAEASRNKPANPPINGKTRRATTLITGILSILPTRVSISSKSEIWWSIIINKIDNPLKKSKLEKRFCDMFVESSFGAVVEICSIINTPRRYHVIELLLKNFFTNL